MYPFVASPSDDDGLEIWIIIVIIICSVCTVIIVWDTSTGIAYVYVRKNKGMYIHVYSCVHSSYIH